MSELTIKSNYQPHDLLSWWELTPTEQKEFDYRTPDEWEEGYSCNFFRYCGNVYDAGEFMRIFETAPDEFHKWDGYQSDSFFSGILVKYVNDFEQVIVATYFS